MRDLVDLLLTLAFLVILARFILDAVAPRGGGEAGMFLRRLTDPVLHVVRRLTPGIPDRWVPIVALLLILVVRAVLLALVPPPGPPPGVPPGR
ncbi:MAG TPA: YggT family protein [Candidatus Limnocylindrales bacterium]|nr:YggT family protein [Candidatus Limnocylindrales bacterium]